MQSRFGGAEIDFAQPISIIGVNHNVCREVWVFLLLVEINCYYLDTHQCCAVVLVLGICYLRQVLFHNKCEFNQS